MTNVFDVKANELIEKVADELKKVEALKPPEWAKFVKTGHGRQRPPSRDDWWYVRAASILRTLYIYGPIGVSRLRTKYGCRKRRGHKPEKFTRGSGNIIRKILQQLEQAGLVQKSKGKKAGRELTPKGKSFLDKTASLLK
ncbi:MAG: 30S ribosomal protein S19e [Candidatus Parvarchaeota archaeon]|nr:30S ribosomal protein S19e [Candidatus Jingweiarchaeum tengchongense]MCW1298222.1 30S ribosomal protein S19e [Candidatus Jingweiarchaeum tengchongense]MCW1300020.1 30S ribosomal protein S19e [Candidatus Jingweiarchaeum tengchongense]MCW1304841.1 30S ribosomal protein S19e [Candidatus Jingweiarchaeum tengchongense]MCW1305431.1 30S ribosomal protein S19e [Candidatus Jingweiarchaeum tengchongense]